MRDYATEKQDFSVKFSNKLLTMFGRTPQTASTGQFYEALARLTRDLLMEQWTLSRERVEDEAGKELYYLSMEFLMGRTLGNNLINLGIEQLAEDVCAEFGHPLADIREKEADAGLGNGGLGRLAACFMDSLSTLGLVGSGCGIRYENGLFKQRIIDGYQVESSDPWLEHGSAWEVQVPDETESIRFGGVVEYAQTKNGLKVRHVGYQTVLAVPYDVPVLGYHSQVVNVLRLWAARAVQRFDMGRFGAGEYLSAVEERESAEVISKVLYPEDQHREGKELRLKQQYFFVSASIQSMLRKYRRSGKPLANLADHVVVHINDTHPTLAIPELMRILLDEDGLEWDEAWQIAKQVFAYTNHTILAEALERWPQDLLRNLLPRIYDIIDAINEQFCKELWQAYPEQWDLIRRMAIISDGYVHMAHLAIVGSFSVNGVAQLHADILKEQVFADFHHFYPGKFRGITNGVSFRRFILKANPELAQFVSDSIGSSWILRPQNLRKFARVVDEPGAAKRLREIRLANKEKLAEYILETTGISVDPQSIFDVHIKRIHEYKRQLLNVLHILHLYYQLKRDPSYPMHPRTFIFAGKAAPGYRAAKQVIKLIHNVGQLINNDESINGRIKVVFLDDYRVSLAEKIIPATDVSEQISTAGKEASGTGNMKFQLNGALTVGTLDGANVEMQQAVGAENIYVFGLTAAETNAIYQSGGYDAAAFAAADSDLRFLLEKLVDGSLSPGHPDMFRDLYQSLVHGMGGAMADPYLVLQDFQAYCAAQKQIDQDYQNPELWWRRCLINIAHAGFFSSDRTIREYNEEIWHLPQHDFSTFHIGTGLYNYSYMERLMENMQAGCSVIAIDIRDFRSYNRALSYTVGDRLLRHAAQVMDQTVRSEDVVGMSKTGNLLVLMSQCPRELADSTAVKIQAALTKSPYGLNGDEVTIHTAAAIHRCDRTDTARGILSNLQLALDEAKRRGADTVIHVEDLQE